MIRFLDAAGLTVAVYAVEVAGRTYSAEEVAAALRELRALRMLYEDVARWRESGDARDLLYVLETMDKIDTAHSSDGGAGVCGNGAQMASRGFCEVDGCGEKCTGLSQYCKKHDMRNRRHGDPTIVLRAWDRKRTGKSK